MSTTPTDPAALAGCDVVFVAVPSGRSQAIVPQLMEVVPLVVDLGADFRLRDPAAYGRWYGFVHTAPELLGRAVYGLPELTRAELAGASAHRRARLLRDGRGAVRSRRSSPPASSSPAG